MARKQKHEEHENHERWLVSYADFITLLFAFFVVMYAISSVNSGKYRVLSDSMVAAFRDVPKSMDPIQVGNPSKSPIPENQDTRNKPTVLIPPISNSAVEVKEASPKNKPIRLFGETSVQEMSRDKKLSASQGAAGQNAAQQKSLPEVAAAIAQALDDLVRQQLISLHSDKRWLEIEINESVLFASGRARPESHALPVMKRIAEALSPFPNTVHVEGFTDNIPINTFMFASNWELSAARAASVAHLLANDGIAESRLVALGYGEQRPVADNATAEGRRQNRRIVLVVLADEGMRQQLETKHAGISRDRIEPAVVSDNAQEPVESAPTPALKSDVVTPAPVPLAVDVSTPALTPVESQATVAPTIVAHEPVQATVSAAPTAPTQTARRNVLTGRTAQTNETPVRAASGAPEPVVRPIIVTPVPPIRLFTPFSLPPITGPTPSPARVPSQEARQ